MIVKEKKKAGHTYQFEGNIYTQEYMLTVRTRCGSYLRFELVDSEKAGEEGVLADLHNPTASLRSIESIQSKFELRRKREGHNKYSPMTPHVVHSNAPAP